MSRTKGSDDLYRLIHSLSSAEKRYFKKFASRHSNGGSKYLGLFNAINRQSAFEETSLKKNFEAYTAMKAYLFDMLLKSLIVNAEDLEKPEQLMLQVIGSRILQRRGLNDKARRMVEKGLDRAREAELFLLEEEFLFRLYSARNQTFSPKEHSSRLKWFADMEAARQKQANYARYLEEDMKVSILNDARIHRGENIPGTGAKVDLEFLRDRSSALSGKNENARLFALSRYYSNYRDFDQAYPTAGELFQRLRKAFISKPPRVSFHSYLNALSSLLTICANANRVKEGLELLNKEMKMKLAVEEDRAFHFNHLSYIKTGLLYCSGRHSEGEEFLQKNLPKLLDPKYSVRFNFNIRVILAFKILFEFSNGNFHQAYLSVNDYQARYDRKSHSRFFKDCELLKILIQVEMGHFKLTPSLIRNALRNKQLGLTDFNKEVLNILKDMTADNKKQVFAQLSQRYPMNVKEEGLLSYFGVREWIQSRHSGTPLSKVLVASLAREGTGNRMK